MNERAEMQSGWVNLCVTFASVGLSVPPIPETLRGALKNEDQWFWSTRQDIDPFEMYKFGYVKELLQGPIEDYAAISHRGHGINSYGLNVSVVANPVAIIFQHGWGGGYMDPLEMGLSIAASFYYMRELFAAAASQPREDGLSHIIAWSHFRGPAKYYVREPNHQWRAETYRPHVRYGETERAARDAFSQESDLGKACRIFLDAMTSPRDSIAEG